MGGQERTVNNNRERIKALENLTAEQAKLTERLDERTKNTREDVKEIKSGVEKIIRALSVPRDPAR